MQRIKDIENRIFYIYVLKHPLTLEIRYVGVTCTTLKARLSQHIHDSKKKNTYKRNWINSLPQRPIIEQIEICNYTNWEEREKYWISYYENLTNTREGGGGVVLERTKESIQKSSEAKYKPVICIDNNKNIQKFKSLKEATEITGVPRTSIQYSLVNINNSSYGFKFLYEKDYYEGIENDIKINLKKYKYKILHCNKSYTPIEFSQLLNVSETIVYLWCEGKVKWENAFNYDGNNIVIIKI